MSAEGKKKRGASGLSNAQTTPFRLNGRPPDWQARSAGCFATAGAPSSGSTTMRGLLGGIICQNLGLGNMVGDFERLLTHAEKRCRHPYFVPADEA